MQTYDQVRIISFDAVGTLISPTPSVGAVYAGVLARNRITLQPELVEHVFQVAYKEALKSPRTTINERSERMFWRQVVYNALQNFCPPEKFDSIFAAIYDEFSKSAAWRLSDDAFSVLAELNARGFRIIVITNGDARIRKVLQESSIGPSIEHIFLSTEIGFEKPSPAIFRHVEQHLELPPEAFLHVGDSVSADADGAVLAGWSALLLSQAQADQGFEQVKTLADIPPLLPDMVLD